MNISLDIRDWANIIYRLAVIVLLSLIVWKVGAQQSLLSSIDLNTTGSGEIKEVRIVNDNNQRIPVDADIAVKTDYVGGVAIQESLPVKVTNNGLTERVPVETMP